MKVSGHCASVCLGVFVVFGFCCDLPAQAQGDTHTPVLQASLRAGHQLPWQRVSPTIGKPEGPVLYQILFRSSAKPGFVPKIDSNFTLTNSLITEDNAGLHIGALAIAPSGAITLCCGQSFGAGGTVTNIATGTGLTGGPITTTGTIAIADGGVTSAQIGSGAAAIGQVLTANGSGGAGWQSVPAAWTLTGNAGTGCTTSPCTSFFGTTDNSALEIQVNGNRAFRLEPATNNQYGFSPNVIGGFSGNVVTGAGVIGATIAGGGAVGGSIHTVSGQFGSIGGGIGNTVSSYASTVAGGQYNTASGNSYSSVGGGLGNTASADYAAVGGGYQNKASSLGSNVTGGTANTASGFEAVVAGGTGNTASGLTAIVAGGLGNTASGDYSFAAGQHANTNSHPGTLVWGDNSTTTDVTATADNQFVARSSGGVIFYTQSDLSTGVSLAAGGGSWSSLSDRNVKANFAAVDVRQILARVLATPVTTWNYKSQPAAVRHIGPMAQDFYSSFQVGEDDKHITEVDEGGVALAAIQGLYEISREKDLKIALLQKNIEVQQQQIEELQRQLRAIIDSLKN
jgi:hypothetical protein